MTTIIILADCEIAGRAHAIAQLDLAAERLRLRVTALQGRARFELETKLDNMLRDIAALKAEAGHV